MVVDSTVSIAGRAARIIRCQYPDVEIPEVPITDFVFARAAGRGDKPAIVDGASGRTLTYADLMDAIRRTAAGLAARGFAKGDVLGIYSPNVPDYAVAFHAAASLGGISTTVNPLYTTRELAQQLTDCRARFLLTVPALIDNVRAAAERVPSVREIFVFGEAEGATPFADLQTHGDQPPHVAIDPRTDLVALPYSSGTTGLAKGVMLTHHNLVAELNSINGRPDVVCPTDADTLLAFLPFFHIYGIVMFLNFAFWRGATVVSMSRFDLEQFLELIERFKVTYLHLVPPIVIALAKHPMVDKYDLSSAKWALSAAAPLGGPTADAFTARLGTKLVQAYGMTEVSGATHFGSCEPGKLMPASGGTLVPNTECLIVDPGSGEAMDRGQQGEIWVRGPLIMQGYLGRPEATADTIDADGWLHTGDVGYVDDEGNIYILDRVKELIKYKGLQVAPAELEAILLEHPSVADAAVIPSPDEEAGEVPKAFIVLKTPTSAEDIMAFVAARVAPHKRVRKLQFIDAIPKSASGKILRRVLVEEERAMAAAALGAGGASAARG
ncbi:MAG TPA: 4-coumarate--CoA ligase family protein [Chloroflexota bacterium]|nr:4-coumarate--CoA ligase family protein [Chloroflexota bacterium]